MKPTIGRIVWYWPTQFDITSKGASHAEGSNQPFAAQIAYVHSDSMVNLTVSDHNGNTFSKTSVQLTSMSDDHPVVAGTATWMPYQVNQAKKEEAAASATTAALPNTDADIEREIQAKGLTTAPRVTPAQIDALMARMQYIVPVHSGETTSTFVHAYLDGTFYVSSGHSACVSLENFDEATGIRIAKGKAQAAARDKLWELEGYRLFRHLMDQVANT